MLYLKNTYIKQHTKKIKIDFIYSKFKFFNKKKDDFGSINLGEKVKDIFK